MATISAAQMKPIISDVMEHSDWDEIEEIIKSLYLDKRTFIHVNWDLYYQALTPMDAPTEESSSNPPPSQSNRPSNILTKPNGSGRDLKVTYMQYWSVGPAIGKVVIIIQSIASSTVSMAANTFLSTQMMFAIGILTFRAEKQPLKHLQTMYMLLCCQKAGDTLKRRK